MTVVEYIVAKGKTEIARHTIAVVGDVVTAAAPGGDPDVSFTLTPALAGAVADGSLDLSVGFMRGDVKMAGDFGALLRVLPVLSKTPHFPAS